MPCSFSGRWGAQSPVGDETDAEKFRRRLRSRGCVSVWENLESWKVSVFSAGGLSFRMYGGAGESFRMNVEFGVCKFLYGAVVCMRGFRVSALFVCIGLFCGRFSNSVNYRVGE